MFIEYTNRGQIRSAALPMTVTVTQSYLNEVQVMLTAVTSARINVEDFCKLH